MKKLALITLVLVVPVAVLVAWSHSDSPTDVARNLVHALEKHDQRQMNDLLCTDALAGVSLAGSDTLVSFNHTTYTEQNKTDGTAIVMITSEVGTAGNSTPTRITWLVTMVKRGRTWCVNSLARASF
jgi:hypothetical protein